jgi:hypothetical protein
LSFSTIRAADELNNNRAPEEAKLFAYDVSQQKIVREIAPIARARTTGLILEVALGRLLGLASHAQQRDQSVLYGVDLANGEVLFTKELPSPVSTDAYWPHWVDPSYEYHAFVHGPDGFVWTYLKDVLVRIDTKDAVVHVVGKIDPLQAVAADPQSRRVSVSGVWNLAESAAKKRRKRKNEAQVAVLVVAVNRGPVSRTTSHNCIMRCIWVPRFLASFALFRGKISLSTCAVRWHTSR